MALFKAVVWALIFLTKLRFPPGVSIAILTLFHRGLRKLARKHWKFGASEFYHGLNRRSQVKRLQKYVPSLRQEDLTR